MRRWDPLRRAACRFGLLCGVTYASFSGCLGRGPSSECRSDEVVGRYGECTKACVDDRDCTGCQKCVEGACEDQRSCVSGGDDGPGQTGDGRSGDANQTVLDIDLTVTPTRLHFGAVTVGTSSPAETFTFANAGQDTATGCEAPVLGGAHGGDFAIVTDFCGTSDLAGNDASCAVSVIASPLAVGARTATLSRACTVGGVASTVVNGIEVTGVAPSLSVDPLGASFGPVPVGSQSDSQVFTFRNDGGGAATGCSPPVLGGAHAADFIITTDNCGAADLAPSGKCTVAVAAKPLSTGMRTATLSRTCTTGGTVSTSVNGLYVNRKHYFFVTSVAYDGVLGGLSGADALCASHASSGSLTSELGLTWKALLSVFGTVDARDRFTWTGPVHDIRDLLATRDPTSWPWTCDGTSPGEGPDLLDADENGNPSPDAYAWSGSKIDGVSKGADSDCNGWTSTSGSGWAGETGYFDYSDAWISSFSSGCVYEWYSIMCVSDGP